MCFTSAFTTDRIMKVVCMLAVVLATVTLSAAYGRYRLRDYDYRYDYEYGRFVRPMRYQDDYHQDDHHDYPYERDHHDHSSEEEDEEETKSTGAADERVYTFEISEDDHGAYMYHDEEGHAMGFEIDLLHAVCEQAGKECYFLLDKGTHCWYNENGHEYPGMGLMAGWFDACLGYFPTVERKNSFDFTMSFTQNMKVALYYKKDAQLMDPEHDHELANHTIGFVEGWPTSQACLDHQTDYHGNHVGEYTAVMYPDTEKMVKAVMNNEVDAVVAPRVLGLDKKGLAHTEPYFECTTDGAAVMARYGDDVIHWWNKALDELHDNGEFYKLCRKASKVHGHMGKIYCS